LTVRVRVRVSCCCKRERESKCVCDNGERADRESRRETGKGAYGAEVELAVTQRLGAQRLHERRERGGDSGHTDEKEVGGEHGVDELLGQKPEEQEQPEQHARAH
jgi:hypothetical protein